MSEPLIKVDDLSIAYASEEGAVQALRHATAKQPLALTSTMMTFACAQEAGVHHQ